MKNSRAIEVSVAPMSHKTIKRRAEPESEGHDRGKALKVKARPLGGIGQEPQPSRRPMHDPEIDDGYNEKEDDDDDEDMEESGSEASGSGHDADGDKERNLQEQVSSGLKDSFAIGLESNIHACTSTVFNPSLIDNFL